MSLHSIAVVCQLVCLSVSSPVAHIVQADTLHTSPHRNTWGVNCK